MTFEELLQKVRESKNLCRIFTKCESTCINESYADEKYGFGLVAKNKGLGFAWESRTIFGSISEIDKDSLQIVLLTPKQFFQLREELNLRCAYWTTRDQKCLVSGN